MQRIITGTLTACMVRNWLEGAIDMTRFPDSPCAKTVARWQASGAGHVAVYGTLRAGGVNDISRLRPGLLSIGRTTLTGCLHDLGWYPGLVLQGTQPVLAEVYPLDDALEIILDGIEGLWPEDLGEYRKCLVTGLVALIGGGAQMVSMLVYEATPATVRSAPVIAASDWLQWFEDQGVQHPDAAFALNTVSAKV